MPDHIGYGKSATPHDRAYTASAHIENLTRLLDALDLTNITLVMHDWGGLFGSVYTLYHPERVKSLVYLNTLSGYGKAPITDMSPFLRAIKERYEAGTVNEIMGNLDLTMLSLMQGLGLQNPAEADASWIAAYSSHFRTAADCAAPIELMVDRILGRVAPLIQETSSLVDNLKSKPAMLAVGLNDEANAPERQIADFRALWPERSIVTLPDAGHFIQEDAPDTAIALVQQFIQAA